MKFIVHIVKIRNQKLEDHAVLLYFFLRNIMLFYFDLKILRRFEEALVTLGEVNIWPDHT